MEGKRVRNAVLVCLVLGLLMGHCTAGLFFKPCYGACFTICMVKKPHNPLTCGFNCLKKCAAPAQTLDFQTNPHHFCKLGCATSLCTHISTKDNPSNYISPFLVRVSFLWYIGLTFLFFFFLFFSDAELVGKCVDSCSGTCSTNYSHASTKNQEFTWVQVCSTLLQLYTNIISNKTE